MSGLLIKLSAGQTVNLHRLMRGPFSGNQLMTTLAHGNEPLWQALHPSVYAIAKTVIEQRHAEAERSAAIEAEALYPDSLKVLNPQTGKPARMKKDELAAVIAQARAVHVAARTVANPTAMLMDQQVLDRLSVFRLAPAHSEMPVIAEELRDIMGGAEIARDFLMNEAKRIIAELEAGGGDRSLMHVDRITRKTHPNVYRVCERVADTHSDFGYEAETIRSWLNKPPKTSRRSSPR